MGKIKKILSQFKWGPLAGPHLVLLDSLLFSSNDKSYAYVRFSHTTTKILSLYKIYGLQIHWCSEFSKWKSKQQHCWMCFSFKIDQQKFHEGRNKREREVEQVRESIPLLFSSPHNTHKSYIRSYGLHKQNKTKKNNSRLCVLGHNASTYFMSSKKILK